MIRETNRYTRITINGRMVYEHRYIMEKHLGRELSSDEFVHHIDGDPKNNKLVNLQVIAPTKHTGIHHTGKTLSEEHKRRLLDANIGRCRVFSEEHKRKMSEAAKIAYKNRIRNVRGQFV